MELKSNILKSILHVFTFPDILIEPPVKPNIWFIDSIRKQSHIETDIHSVAGIKSLRLTASLTAVCLKRTPDTCRTAREPRVDTSGRRARGFPSLWAAHPQQRDGHDRARGHHSLLALVIVRHSITRSHHNTPNPTTRAENSSEWGWTMVFTGENHFTCPSHQVCMKTRHQWNYKHNVLVVLNEKEWEKYEQSNH